MGDMADDAMFAYDQAMQYAEEMEEECEELYRNGIWRMRDGEDIQMQDMDDGHLENSIRFCKRNPNALCALGLPYLQQEFELRRARRGKR